MASGLVFRAAWGGWSRRVFCAQDFTTLKAGYCLRIISTGSYDIGTSPWTGGQNESSLCWEGRPFSHLGFPE